MADDSLRVRGEDALIRIVSGGKLLTTITAIKSLTLTLKMNILREGYLQEKFDRHDNVYSGVGIELMFHPESADAFTLIDLAMRRARREVAAITARFNLTTVFNMPNGQRPRMATPDIVFGDMPINLPARDQYVDIRLSGEGDFARLSGI